MPPFFASIHNDLDPSGGHPASIELMRRARERGIAVVFYLRNFGFNDQ